MARSISENRAMALRVAKGLRDRGKAEEALEILCAWAAVGPNDEQGQGLLAEALRISPKAEIARMAFERMEGMLWGGQTLLDTAIARYGEAELEKLDAPARPAFRKAQVGFNNNVRYKGHAFHVQTEDSGLDKPHVITHLFADGGRIIKSHKRGYAAEVSRPDVALFVRSLMKAQHMEMLLLLREGKLDEIIEGRARGGLEVLEHPPEPAVARIGGERKSQAAAPAAPRSAPPAAPRFRVHVTRTPGRGPGTYEPVGDEVVLGSGGDVPLPGERFCHPREAAFKWDAGKLWLEDLEGGNGIFLRARTRVELASGDEIVIGDQLLRLERNPTDRDEPDPGPTYFYSSLKGPSSFRVTQVLEGGALGACALARGATLQVGSVQDYANDMILFDDPLVEPYHCVIEEHADSFILSDLGTRSGVYVRVVGRHALASGDELLVGRTRMRIELLV